MLPIGPVSKEQISSLVVICAQVVAKEDANVRIA